MKSIKELFQNVEYEILQGSDETPVTDVSCDSRKIHEGSAFFCFIGAAMDGHKFAVNAIKAGASVLVIQRDIDEELSEGIQNAGTLESRNKNEKLDGTDKGKAEAFSEMLKKVTIIKTSDTRYALALAAAEISDHPARKMLTIAITGTKGKTSITSMIQKILTNAGHKVGTIGTVGADCGGEFIKTETTTPESTDVEAFFQKMVDNGCDVCVMEVSSQALMLHRVSGIMFDYGLFTNLSPDHIGGAEHKDMDDYIHCKSLLFRQCRHGHFNLDDEHFPAMVENCTCDITTYSCRKQKASEHEKPLKESREGKESGSILKADLLAENIRYVREAGFLGMEFETTGSVNESFRVSAPGEFSVYNALAAISVCHMAGVPVPVIQKSLMEIHVRGRMEPVKISPRFTLLIDYAHNAVAMESILKAMRKYEPKRIVSLFGCGGNRSRIRRFEMGEISGLYADFSILTEDNSRLEDVNDIIQDIVTGISKTDGEYVIIPDRKEAIRYSIENAREGDIILLLGKGHEDYQDKNGKKTPFDERVIIREILEEINWKYE